MRVLAPPEQAQASLLALNLVGVEKLGSKTRFLSGEFLPFPIFLS
jgi:hypothetical protein